MIRPNGELDPVGPGMEHRLIASSDLDAPGDQLEVSMGPQHPSTHGVFRMDVVLDGERVV